jgi:hypothetical protein
MEWRSVGCKPQFPQLLLLHFNDDTEQLTPEVFAYKKGEIL